MTTATTTKNIFDYFDYLEEVRGLRFREMEEDTLFRIMKEDEENARRPYSDPTDYYKEWLSFRGIVNDEFVSTWYMRKIFGI